MTQPCTDAQANQYLPLVRAIARSIVRTLPRRVDQEELLKDMIQEGSIGLLKALAGFDPGRGVKFVTYATIRIRGAIKDALRRGDHLSRSHRHNIDKADPRVRAPLSLDHNMPHGRRLGDVQAREQSFGDLLEDPAATADFRRIDELDEIDGFMRRLPDRLGEIARLRFLEGWKMRRIAEHLGLTESRVSQLMIEISRYLPIGRFEGEQNGMRLLCDDFPGEKLSVREAARRAGVSLPTIYRTVRDGTRAAGFRFYPATDNGQLTTDNRRAVPALQGQP